MKHPIQPLYKDNVGTLRFKENAIVRFLLDNGPHDLDALAKEKFTQEDREQFAQLIGYSLMDFGKSIYVSDETYAKAECQPTNTDQKTVNVNIDELPKVNYNYVCGCDSPTSSFCMRHGTVG